MPLLRGIQANLADRLNVQTGKFKPNHTHSTEVDSAGMDTKMQC